MNSVEFNFLMRSEFKKKEHLLKLNLSEPLSSDQSTIFLNYFLIDSHR